MFNLLFFLIIVILVIVLVVVSAVLGFVRSLFGFGRRKQQPQYSAPEEFNQQTQKQKVFNHDEGEYVDFEEIK